ncbi:MAG: hypothetical protein IKB76_01095 [Kiritimatiellae bacterium]|nr:hypothetical protein [Kiritimatiellia bacterium]
MSTDYIVASLPTLAFNAPAPLSWEKFAAITGGGDALIPAKWTDLETQLRNAMAEARGGERFRRPADGCSLYWKNRVLACFQEKDVARRDELLDRVWWDAAGELTPPSAPLGKGALATYAIRLKVALKRTMISKDTGNAAFDRLTAETKR